jgi:hypothetical protein
MMHLSNLIVSIHSKTFRSCLRTLQYPTMENPEATIQPKLKVFPMILLAFLGLLVLLFGGWIILQGFQPRYPQVFPVIFGALIAGLGIYLFSLVLRTRVFVPGKYQFTVRSVTGRTIDVIGYNEITGYSEHVSKQKQKEIKELIIWYRQGRISMSSSFIDNYEECKWAITKNKTRNTQEEMQWKQKKAAQA